jgi:DNA polymerase delta subunit 1
MQIDVDCDVISHLYNMEQEKSGGPLLRMYGITMEGNSVCVLVENFHPYFYVKMPPEFLPVHLDDLKAYIHRKLQQEQGGIDKTLKDLEICEKTDIFHYTQTSEKFIKIVLFSPKYVSSLREAFEHGVEISGMQFDRTTYESKVNFPLRYMIDRGIVGMSWITLPKNMYKMRIGNKVSHCQVEVEISYLDIISHSPEGEFSKIAPIRILSLDIECAAPQGRFPNAQNDPVIQIANICIEFGNPDPIIQNIFTFKSCAPISGAEVYSFEKEEDLLDEWRQFILDLDPDIITGYNINNFDIPYLINRAETLKVKDFNRISRMTISQSKVKHNKSKVKGFKNREFTDINLDGRILVDMCTHIMKEHKLRSFTLNNVSFHFLGEQKEDVHHSMIYDLWKASEFTRRRLAIYCLKDAYLPLKLADKLMTLYNFAEMCRVTCTPLSFILTRGQQIKVSSQLHRKALEKGYLIPTIKIKKGAEDSDEEGFEGAFVLDPTTGYYTVPIVTLDFASLYPSIMMAHNLCYSTLLRPGEERNLNENDYVRTPTGDCFVKEHIRKGILPIILEELITARKKAKEELKSANEASLKAVLDGRQLALKISANSVYGFTGAQVGQLPCLQISASVTAFGRGMIENTKDIVQRKFSKLNGYSHDANVIYGDTDSVMIKFGCDSLKEAMKLGKEASLFVTEHYKKPIKIEFEKVYYPYLLMKKKKYAGLIWTREEKWDKLDTKGLEAVRRDNCELVRDMVEVVLKKVLIEKSVEDAVNHCKGIISDLLQNRIDISLLVISKTLSKKSAEEEEGKVVDNKNKKNTYQAKQAHVELAEKLRIREPGTAPGIGDRVPYVIIRGNKNSKFYENSEDPKYVLENDIPLDNNYYLEHQIKKPLIRIFHPILESKTELTLFSGDHMKVISNVCGKNNPMAKFFVTKLTCLNCKTTINSGVVCKNCKHKLRDIYLERRLEANYYERIYNGIFILI